jgi:hypothetical protein
LERIVASGSIVAVGLLTKNDVRLLGPTFDRLWPVDEAPSFTQLLSAIDEAEQNMSVIEVTQDL